MRSLLLMAFLLAALDEATAAMHFDGVDDVVRCGDIPIDGLQQVTISFWSRRGAPFANIGIGKGSQSQSNLWSIHRWTDGIIYLDLESAAAPGCYVKAADTKTNTLWTHLLLRYDGGQVNALLRPELWQDGTKHADLTNNPAVEAPFASFPSSTNVFTIGAIDGIYGTGDIDDVRIYYRLLKDQEIQDMARGMFTSQEGDVITPFSSGMEHWPLNNLPDGTSANGKILANVSDPTFNGVGSNGTNGTGCTALPTILTTR